jgi:hypothetical protein
MEGKYKNSGVKIYARGGIIRDSMDEMIFTITG